MAEQENPPVQHVEPRGQQWAVRKEGALQASQYFPTREEAEERARQLAAEQESAVLVHDREGKVTKRWDRF